MIKYPINTPKLIKKIVDDFGLYNKKEKTDNTIKKVFNEPSVIISELFVRNKKNALKEEEIINYLEEKLQINKEKARKLKTKLEEEILSKTTQQKQEKGPDKYREHIE